MPSSVLRYERLDSPLGELLLTGDGETLSGLFMSPFGKAPEEWPNAQRDPGAFAEVRRQLAAYFAHELQVFELPLAFAGTAFQVRVWNELLRIPFGTTITYRQLAERIGNAKACRAVGLANGKNPIAIIAPCHRVIGSDGSLTGYGGGLDRKRWLLAHERGGTLF
ncbi:MAG: methylated-DNA--[protein]-cysteine S-methyltransferase [Gammaproteobacteria bacterium]|nr:methylated-DNA--[protein]-cysteine S-methyltransferase [Gammaproteobacteria bacterium]